MTRTAEITLIASAIASAGLGASEPGGALGPAGMPSYEQTVSITFRSVAAATAAQVTIAPLYHDLSAAFSTRMDDSNVNDLRVADLLGPFGQKGTFYLNDPDNWWQDSDASGIVRPRDPGRTIPPILLAGGNSIGGHTLNHEMLPALSKNAAFREIMGARIALESRTASPNICFVYPFVYFESPVRDGSDRADLEEMLRRSGYYQLGEHRYNRDWDSGFQDAIFIVCDGSHFDGYYSESVLNEPRTEDDRPLFLVTMHAWVSAWGAGDFPKLASIYKKWSGNPRWWYCNQNQYAAYRYQALHSRLASFRQDSTLKLVLRRPDPLDLGDWVPLTIVLRKVAASDILSVNSDSAAVTPVSIRGDYGFDWGHDHDKGPVEEYARMQNPSNAAGLGEPTTGPEGLQARIQRTGARLSLQLRNAGPGEITHLRVVFRLPLRWQPGVIRRDLGALAPGMATSVDEILTPNDEPAGCADGPELDVAQIDYVGQHRARAFASCESPGEALPAYFAREGFNVLGPLPRDAKEFSPNDFATPFIDGEPPQSRYKGLWVSRLQWRTESIERAAILDPDLIPTSGRSNTPNTYVWDRSVYSPHQLVSYLLHGLIYSAVAQTVELRARPETIALMSVNGRRETGDQLHLRQGVNDLRVLYTPAAGIGSTFDETNYGCYFRLVNDRGDRIENVRFQRPPAP